MQLHQKEEAEKNEEPQLAEEEPVTKKKRKKVHNVLDATPKTIRRID